ncbi:MAG: Nicotinamidase [Ktedonobacterales bacterium]|nr:MAG: Nicotinamidase [Ktedonobacterales bacterium]
MATEALLIVDAQNDFCPGGALAVPEGHVVMPVLNAYIARARAAGMPIFASRDWHPPETVHFTTRGGPWPEHCVQGTRGAEFHPDLRLPPETVIFTKGMSGVDDGYSMFEGMSAEGQTLLDVLRAANISHVHVGGLATDYCVRATVLDARRAGLDVSLLTDAIRAVEVTAGDGQRAVDEMLAAGATPKTLADFAMEK